VAIFRVIPLFRHLTHSPSRARVKELSSLGGVRHASSTSSRVWGRSISHSSNCRVSALVRASTAANVARQPLVSEVRLLQQLMHLPHASGSLWSKLLKSKSHKC
jgi:hypothetical protein